MNFYTWLMNQESRDDPVGDLANDTALSKDCPQINSSLYVWGSYLRNKNASREAIDALQEAFAEYRERN